MRHTAPKFMANFEPPKVNGVARYAYCTSFKCSDYRRPQTTKNGVLKHNVPITENYCPDCGGRLIWSMKKGTRHGYIRNHSPKTPRRQRI